MHIPDCSEGSVEVKHGSIVNISRGTYEGRLVAIKVLNVCVSHFVILSVSVLSTLPHPSEWANHRDFTGRLLFGNTYGIPTSCHSLE